MTYIPPQVAGFGFDVRSGRLGSKVSSVLVAGYSETVGTTLKSLGNGISSIIDVPHTVSFIAVASTSANDTSAGTGARTVLVTGLDTDYNPTSETITLNGQTKVASVGKFRRVNSVVVLTAGSGNENAGDIYVGESTDTFTAGVPSNPFLGLDAGWNLSRCAYYTVPAVHTAYLTEFNVSTDGDMKPAEINVEIRAQGSNIWTRLARLHVGVGSAPFPTPATTAIGEKYDIRITAKTTTGTTSVMAFMHLFLEEA